MLLADRSYSARAVYCRNSVDSGRYGDEVLYLRCLTVKSCIMSHLGIDYLLLGLQRTHAIVEALIVSDLEQAFGLTVRPRTTNIIVVYFNADINEACYAHSSSSCASKYLSLFACLQLSH